MFHANDVKILIRKLKTENLKTDRFMQDGIEYRLISEASLQLADWVEHVTEEVREKLQKKAVFHFLESYPRDFPALSHSWPGNVSCLLEDCGSEGSPGYLLLSKEEMVAHCREIHGHDDEQIASLEHYWDMKNSDNGNNMRQMQQRKRSGSGDLRACTKRVKSLTSKDIGDVYNAGVVDLTED